MPNAPGIEYSALYGLEVFRCESLLATLQPKHCAERWRHPNPGSACQRCTIGAAHAGEVVAPPPRNPECCRCGRTGQRLLAKSICVSCNNRAREVVNDCNAKGLRPSIAGQKLRWGYAIAQCEISATASLSAMFERRRTTGGIWTSGLRSGYLPGLPHVDLLDSRHVWISSVCMGAEELARIVLRLLPGAEITDYEVGPTFSELWAADSR